MGLLKQHRDQRRIVLASGIGCTIQQFIGQTQAKLTKDNIPVVDRLNWIIADSIVSIDGVDYADMTEAQKMAFVGQMLDGDRNQILMEARQYSMGYPTTFSLPYEWKENGVRNVQQLELTMLNDSNLNACIDSFVERYGCDRERVAELNHAGGMAVKPYKRRFEAYPLNREDLDYEVHFGSLRIKFSLLTGAMQNGLKVEQVDSHTKILLRKPRVWDDGSESWKSITRNDLDEAGIYLLEQMRMAIEQEEGSVDSFDSFEHPSTGKTVLVNVLGEVAFFFPSGKL